MFSTAMLMPAKALTDITVQNNIEHKT